MKSFDVILSPSINLRGKNTRGSFSTGRNHKSMLPTPVAEFSRISREANDMVVMENLSAKKI